MKIVTVFMITIMFAFIANVNAQDAEAKAEEVTYGWKNQVVSGLNLTQTSFDNWSQGGESSISWQFNLNANFIYDQLKYNWANSGKISYGNIKAGDEESRKSVDEIKVESVYSYKMSVLMNPYAAVSVETQFSKGYDYSQTPKQGISNFLDPAYFMQSVGMGYFPHEQIKTRLGVALKETITNDYPRYSDDPETINEIEKSRVEFGAESVTDMKMKLADNILMTSKLELFSTLDKFDEIDVRWDTIFVSKLAKYVDVNFNVKLFYDKDISKKRQLKQALAIGLTYNFL